MIELPGAKSEFIRRAAAEACAQKRTGGGLQSPVPGRFSMLLKNY
jgi:hypothetical protein